MNGLLMLLRMSVFFLSALNFMDEDQMFITTDIGVQIGLTIPDRSGRIFVDVNYVLPAETVAIMDSTFSNLWSNYLQISVGYAFNILTIYE